MRNGKDACGKSNKHLYSKIRRLYVAALLALQDAYENEISFMDAIALQNAAGKEPEQITLSEWDIIAKNYLQAKRRFTDKEVTEIGKMYCDDALRLLPLRKN